MFIEFQKTAIKTFRIVRIVFEQASPALPDAQYFHPFTYRTADNCFDTSIQPRNISASR
jgi:hypothetical protein